MRTGLSAAPARRAGWRWLPLAGAALAVLLGGCAGGDDGQAIRPSASNPPVPEAAQDFQRKCEQGLNSWREGQITYPRRLTIPLDETVTYEAVVDINENPLPPDEIIEADGGAAGTERLFVRCRLAAKLSALEDGLDVSQDPDAEGSGWIYQEFTPSGVIEWSWAVTATEPVDQRLRLELRPALQVNELASYATANQVSFTTDVTVEASPLQRMWHWMQTQWPLVVGIATPLGAAILALLGWIQKVRSSTQVPDVRPAQPGPPLWQPPAPPPVPYGGGAADADRAPPGAEGARPDQPDPGRAQPGGSP